MNVGTLFTPVVLGAIALPSRIVMAPMTRLRASADGVPLPLVAEYYAQRASAGLIITESLMTAHHGDGFGPLPGLYTNAQEEGWRAVVDRVHAAGGRIVAQLASVGRARFEPGRGLGPGWAMAEKLEPHQFTLSELTRIVEGFGGAARRARSAGFDGVEIHNGNGFLFDQFLRADANHRADAYGGPLRNRLRLTLEIAAEVVGAWTADRVGLRLSPNAGVDARIDPTAFETFRALLRELASLKLAYTHLTTGNAVPIESLRPFVQGAMVATGGFTQTSAEAALARGIDAIGFAQLFVSNPDLPARFAQALPLTLPDSTTFYTQGPTGYTDYPASG